MTNLMTVAPAGDPWEERSKGIGAEPVTRSGLMVHPGAVWRADMAVSYLGA